jgi:anti-sigma B factor antagonist
MSDDAEAFPADVLRIEASHDCTGTTITLAGEFDMTGTDRFWAFVSEALAEDPKEITVDAQGLEFIDSSGLLALLRARDAGLEAGVPFAIRHPSAALRRIVELCGVAELLAPE